MRGSYFQVVAALTESAGFQNRFDKFRSRIKSEDK